MVADDAGPPDSWLFWTAKSI